MLRIHFGLDPKAGLDNGLIRIMAGGTRRYNRIQTNLIVPLGNVLRGSGCRPNVSDMGAIPSVELIALVDPTSERLHILRRTGHRPQSWSEVIHVEPADLELPFLGISIPHSEIFARD